MEEAFVLLVQIVAELILFISASAPIEIALFLSDREQKNYTVLKCFGLAVLGGLVGLISLWYFPKAFIAVSWLRWSILLLGPIFMGWGAAVIARYVSRKKEDVWPHRHFWYVFFWSLGCALVRFAFPAR